MRWMCLGGCPDAALAAGDPDEAIASAERMLVIDPLREDVHRRLMRACASAGRRTEALRHYNAATELLGRELAVTPSPETEALAKQIRAELNATPIPATARVSSNEVTRMLPYCRSISSGHRPAQPLGRRHWSPISRRNWRACANLASFHTVRR